MTFHDDILKVDERANENRSPTFIKPEFSESPHLHPEKFSNLFENRFFSISCSALGDSGHIRGSGER
jgi:hypothetical protein